MSRLEDLNNIEKVIKVLRNSGEEPTIPAYDFKSDGTWINTDIYNGQISVNIENDKLFYRHNSGITEVVTTPAGNDTEIQFNSGGSFASSSDFTYNDSTKTINLNGNVKAITYYGSFLQIGNDTGYTNIEADGTIKFNGDATVWEDLRFPATSINPVGTAGPMTFDQTNIGFLASKNSTTSIAIIGQIPHSYKEGSDIYPHIHWMPLDTNTGNVYWRIEYKWVNIGDVEPSGWTTLNVLDDASGTAYTHQLSNFDVISGSGKKISSIITIKISRIGNDATDTYDYNTLLKEFDIHYESDTIGSREEYFK